ncbi:MAG: hypothetical protein R3247_06785 [Rhodothermales bacterium]|nr:hypothetical protein [Rhodothermales bacterium]
MNPHRILSFFALATLLAIPAQAQHTSSFAEPAGEPEAFTRFFGHQLATSLGSDVEEIRFGALDLVMQYARDADTRVDLKPAVPALHTMYRRDAVEQCRYTSVAALHALGAEAELWRLADAVLAEPSERVQRITLAALVDRYGIESVAQNKDLVRLARRLMKSRPHVEVGGPSLITMN